MAAAVTHRGPDDGGFCMDGELALGQGATTLSTSPEARSRSQNEDRTFWVVSNGEI